MDRPSKQTVVTASTATAGVASLGLALDFFSRYMAEQKTAAAMLVAAQDKATQAQALLTQLEQSAGSLATCQANLVEVALRCVGP